MIRNHNGYWMSPKFFGMSPAADDAGDVGGIGGGTGAPAGDADTGSEQAGVEPAEGQNVPEASKPVDNSLDALNAEIARLKAEAAKNKAALDKATSEAGNLRKELRSKMTQEQIDAVEKQEAADKTAKELEDLRRQVAKGNTVKTVMGKLGLGEDEAGNLADFLYGAADIDNALLEIQKAWQAREKKLKLEYGKITGPGTGADSNSPEAKAVRMAAEIGKQRNAQNEQAQKAMNAYMR